MLAATAPAAALLALAAPAPARDAIVVSADGTPIVASFHPAEGLAPGAKAPTILITHGWGGNRDADGTGTSSEATGTVGAAPLRKAGFNVLTWDSRGFGQSGGTVTVDYKDNEGRDVQALIDYLAKQPEAQLDGPGDPRVGMHGGSYAGGIELVAAGFERRIDAIAPDIAWHSLLTSLYKEETVKGGWALALYGAGVPTSGLEGIVSPAGVQTGTLDPHITSAFVSGASTGKLSAEDRAWFDSRGPSSLVNAIRVPTLLIQGTADTLFTLDEAMTNYRILRGNGVPAKMVWFCGGHGTCLTGSGEAGHVERTVIAWMKRHLAGDASVDTGPRFEWLADDAKWRSAADFPPPAGAPLVAEGSGRLRDQPRRRRLRHPGRRRPRGERDQRRGAGPEGRRAGGRRAEAEARLHRDRRRRRGLRVRADRRRDARRRRRQPGAPDPARARRQAAHDRAPARGDRGQPHARVQAHAADHGRQPGLRAGPHGRRPQIVSTARLEIPTVGAARRGRRRAAGVAALPVAAQLRDPPARAQAGRLRVRGTRVTVAGQRVKVFRKRGRVRARVNLRGKAPQRVRVKVVARTTRGKVLRDTRVYRTCMPKRKKR